MKISINADYMLRAVFELAKNESAKPISISKIASNQHIPSKFLEKLFRKLKKFNIVESKKGKTGGYLLKHSPDKITMHQIIQAAEGGVKIHNCLERSQESNCANVNDCNFRVFWSKFNQNIDKFLKSYTLDDFLIDK